jgi:hypothetical protein
MERLRVPVTLKEKFLRVLKEERLDDPAQFFRAGFFDEIPLYSRYSQLSFLEQLPRDRANATLVRLSLDFLHRLTRSSVPSAGFLAAVTFNRYSKQEYLVPNVFVCHGKIDELIKGGLVLRAPGSVLASRLIETLGEVSDARRYLVLQDTQTIPREPRVFIGLRRHPHPLMVGIDALSPAREPENGRATRIR